MDNEPIPQSEITAALRPFSIYDSGEYLTTRGALTEFIHQHLPPEISIGQEDMRAIVAGQPTEICPNIGDNFSSFDFIDPGIDHPWMQDWPYQSSHRNLTEHPRVVYTKSDTTESQTSVRFEKPKMRQRLRHGLPSTVRVEDDIPVHGVLSTENNHFALKYIPKLIWEEGGYRTLRFVLTSGEDSRYYSQGIKADVFYQAFAELLGISPFHDIALPQPAVTIPPSPGYLVQAYDYGAGEIVTRDVGFISDQQRVWQEYRDSVEEMFNHVSGSVS